MIAKILYYRVSGEQKKKLKVIQRQKDLHVVKIKVVDAFLLQEKLLKPSACNFVLSSALIAIEE